MIVTCERCATQFQLDESRVPSDGVRVRCSRCKHAFLVEPPARTEADKIHRVALRALDADTPPDATQDLVSSSVVSNEPADDEEESDWQFNDDDDGFDADSEPAAHPDAMLAAENAVDDLLSAPALTDDSPLPDRAGLSDFPIPDDDSDPEDLDATTEPAARPGAT